MRRSSSSLALRQRLSASQARPSIISLAITSRAAITSPRSTVNVSERHLRSISTTNVRLYSTSRMSNTDATPTFKEVNYELLDELRRFWFEHIDDESRLILPDMSVMKRFFMGGEDFDKACTKKFTPALEEIKEQGIISSSTLLTALPPRGPLDWLGFLLLLDQIPRNCYRGEASGQVFTFFDPLALGVALAALEKEIFTSSPVLRWHFAYRFWLCLPLVHSESIAIHDRIVPEIIGPLRADIEALITNSGDREDGSEERKRALAVLQQRQEEGRFLISSQTEAEEKHVSILRKFGRYPHRNGPLGREMRPEEQKYLDEGGDTFAPPKSDEEREKWEAEREAERRRTAAQQ